MKDKKIIYVLVGFVIVLLIGLTSFRLLQGEEKKTATKEKTKTLETKVLAVFDEQVIVQDKNHVIYTFDIAQMSATVGDDILIEYTGLLDKNKNHQTSKVLRYEVLPASNDEDGVPVDYLDQGIFSDYYILANDKLKTLSLDEKIGQLLLVRYPDNGQLDALKTYHFGGYLFFAKDFKDKTAPEVKKELSELQEATNIPLLTAVDEEGGIVVRVSSNPLLAKEKFKSSKELYNLGGMNQIREDTIAKSTLLNTLGLNLNLAPVVDVSTNPNDYMYERTIGQSTDITSDYAKTVIESSKGLGVSYTLKHFPGYGNNADTHTGSATDQRTLEEITKNDLPPFEAGISKGAEAVLVSHNTVTSIDSNNASSLSPSVHNLLRNQLGFTGIIMTDDLAMGAVSSVPDVYVKAILAGNDLLITTDYEESFNSIKKAVQDGTISESLIDKLAFRILAWKYYKGLMFEHK